MCENWPVRIRPALIPVLLSVTLLAAACGDDEPTAASTSDVVSPTAAPTATDSPAPAPAPTPEPAPEPAPETEEPGDDDGPPFDGDRAEDVSPGEGIGLSVVDVRVGAHDGYDRIVFELGGEGNAGWRVGYDDDPRGQGSGEPVDVEGGATLAIVVEGVGYPFDTGVEEYGGPRRFAPGLTSVREVDMGGVFEGYFDAFAGTREVLPFRVFRLESPQRVVIDVAHSG
jgi:hypothetical protein